MQEGMEGLQGNRHQDALRGTDILPLVYQQLRRVAAHQLSQEPPGQLLEPTALVHEAWLRLAGATDHLWKGPGHFFGAAAEAMRRILVDNARRNRRLKHGGGYQRLEIDPQQLAAPLPDEELLALDEALHQLTALDPAAAQLVTLRFFGGLTQAQAARYLRISRSTADRLWLFARAWLFRRLRLGQVPSNGNNGKHQPGAW